MSDSSQARDPLEGQVLGGRFRIEKLLDRGGMGKIYTAIQQPLGRRVALKTLDVMDNEGKYQERFLLEASALAKLSHPNTVRVIDYGCERGIYFFAMEFLEGANLGRVIEEQGALPPLRAIRIVDQIAGALAEAHAHEIVHRDMKPANVFLTTHGDTRDHVKVIDFGLVKDIAADAGLSVTGTVLGTPAYMAPEQIEEGDPDGRTDLYSVGVILFECLTGSVPFKGKNTMATLMMHVNFDPPKFREIAPDVEVPACLEWVVYRCMEKEQSDRFRDMRELSRALRLCAREVAGEFEEPLMLQLKDGVVVVPDGIEENDAHEPLPGPRPTGEVAAPTKPSTLRRVAAPAAMGVGVVGILALLGAGLLVIAAVAVVGAVVWSGSGAPADAAEAPVATRPVVIESVPPGAEVRRDGGTLGTTPFVLDVPEGELVTIDVKMRAYKRESLTLDGSEGKVRVRLIAKTNEDKLDKPEDP